MSQGAPIDKQVRCLVRGTMVAATPEELVRQRLLALMFDQGAYPRGLVAVEVALSSIPHLSQTSHLPLRRADILCFAPSSDAQEGLQPLLLVECKAVPLRDHVVQQVVGYNRYVQAPYIAVVNQDFLRMGNCDLKTGEFHCVEGLIPYSELLSHL